MPLLKLVPNTPAVEPAHGSRRYRPTTSHLQLVGEALPAFPSLRPPETPLLDRALAEEAAREAARPRKAHVFVTDRTTEAGTTRRVTRVFCVACWQDKGPGGVTAKSECTGTLDPRLAAPWL